MRSIFPLCWWVMPFLSKFQRSFPTLPLEKSSKSRLLGSSNMGVVVSCSFFGESVCSFVSCESLVGGYP